MDTTVNYRGFFIVITFSIVKKHRFEVYAKGGIDSIHICSGFNTAEGAQMAAIHFIDTQFPQAFPQAPRDPIFPRVIHGPDRKEKLLTVRSRTIIWLCALCYFFGFFVAGSLWSAGFKVIHNILAVLALGIFMIIVVRYKKLLL